MHVSFKPIMLAKAMVALFSEKGNVIVRFPFELKAAGKNLAAAASIKPFQPPALEGHFEDRHFLGEESDATRFYTFRKIADYGIVAVFARERKLSLAAWRQRSAERIVFSALAILFLSLSLFFLWKHIRRLNHTEESLRRSEASLRASERTESLEHANQDLEIALKSMKNMQAEMFRSEKMAALGYLVAGISHELNTPIGNSLMVASTLKEHAANLASELGSGKPRRTILNELIIFSDNGCGIPPENLKRVFDPFFTTKLGQGGSGLGMNIVYNLVTEVLGGKVELHSELGKGSSLIVRLPVTAPQHEDE